MACCLLTQFLINPRESKFGSTFCVESDSLGVKPVSGEGLKMQNKYTVEPQIWSKWFATALSLSGTHQAA